MKEEAIGLVLIVPSTFEGKEGGGREKGVMCHVYC